LRRISSRRQLAPRRQAGLLLVTVLTSVATVATAAGADEEIIVTGLRPQPLPEVARSVTVISTQDIALSPSGTLVDLLAREANLNLRSITGNEKFSGVDIRGMGDAYVSNVLVLVDGVRLNSPDLAGADLGAIAPAQVERIEIVRGANAVRYGSGAVGGVINIITREAGAQPAVAAQAGVASFDTRDVALDLGADGDDWSASARLSRHDSDGYRDNGELRRTDVQVRADYDFTDRVTASLGGDWHEDDYGLPGPISAEAFEASDSERRASATPNDGGDTRDNRYRLDLRSELPGDASLALRGTLRDRRNRFILGYTPLLDESQQQDEIEEDSRGLELTYDLPFSVGSGRQLLNAGAALSRIDYRRQDDGTTTVDRSRAHDGDIDEDGLFAALTWFAGERWQFNTGYRWNRTELRTSQTALNEVCDYEIGPEIPFPIPVNCRAEAVMTAGRDERWNDSAADIGALWQPRPELHLFVNFSRAFRIPNVDELARADGDLSPQTSDHWEAGLRSTALADLELSFTLFRQHTDDEILYGLDMLTGETVNRNADERTERTGGELEARWTPTPALMLTADAGYVHARFADSGAPMPLVPVWTAGLGLRWQITTQLVASLGGHYVDERSDGNDLAGGAWPELDAYTVADLGLTWQRGPLRCSLGVENLFDEVAATSGYSGARYPLASRSVGADIAIHY
jgi:iron complex outermembrane recepter protein